MRNTIIPGKEIIYPDGTKEKLPPKLTWVQVVFYVALLILLGLTAAVLLGYTTPAEAWHWISVDLPIGVGNWISELTKAKK